LRALSQRGGRLPKHVSIRRILENRSAATVWPPAFACRKQFPTLTNKPSRQTFAMLLS